MVCDNVNGNFKKNGNGNMITLDRMPPKKEKNQMKKLNALNLQGSMYNLPKKTG